jgi:plasmid maintenance system antidote protein VapI
MNLQSHYDLKTARRNPKPKDIKRITAQRVA